MPIYLNERDVAELLDMPSAIEALREAFAARARSEAVIVPRTRWGFGDRKLNVMGGGLRSPSRYALKSYGSSAYHVLLYSREGLLAIIEANVLGQIRTGAASGVASEKLARQNSSKVALIGTGRQARTQALALAAVGMLTELAVSARDRVKLDAFCAALRKELAAPVHAAASAEAAVARGGLTTEREAALEQGLSLEISMVLFVVYLLSLVFSLKTHRHLYSGQDHAGAHEVIPVPAGRAVATLLVATALVAWMSELLVGVVEEVSHVLGLTQVFVGVIVVAVIGNAAEHSTAVLVAMKNKMDLALNIAIGSSIQIALFVAPLLVFASYGIGPRPMDLRFTSFEVLAVGLAVAVVNMVAQDGESNWLEGVLLVAVYLMLGIAFYFLP